MESNAAHLKFYEVLDAWGALSEYIKKYDTFPKCFLDWFESIFFIYQIKDEKEVANFRKRIVSIDSILRLYLNAGLENNEANNSINKLTLVSIDYSFLLSFLTCLTL